jgi:hypothetical protein
MHLTRAGISIGLMISLLAPPEFARSVALGVVVYSDGGMIGESDASEGTTVYDGDRLSTMEDGGLRVNLRTARVQLANQSTVALHSAEKGAEADLSSGGVVFSAALKSGIEVHANGAEIRPAADGPTIGHVLIAGPKDLRIFARRGALEFSYRGESRVISEGAAYRVQLNPVGENAEADSDPNPIKTGSHKPLFIFIAIGAAAAVASIIHVFRNIESPEKP